MHIAQGSDDDATPPCVPYPPLPPHKSVHRGLVLGGISSIVDRLSGCSSQAAEAHDTAYMSMASMQFALRSM